MTAARTGARLVLEGVAKSFAATTAVDGVSLELAPGTFTALLGPSGCGKSTLLALIAGLLVPDAGSIAVDGHDLVRLPAEHRPVGLVFQKPLLFPHLTVEANVAFGLRMRRLPRREIRAAVRDMLERVQLGGLAGRRVGELSGGQEQRVALARALVLAPRVLLLDEPISQLDAGLRSEMRALFRELAAEATVTTLFVTHDQAEAVEVADDIALMLDGRLVGHATPEVFYTRPPSLAAARFFGVTNELAGTVRGGCFRTSSGFQTPANIPDGDAVLVIRPEAVRPVAQAGPDTLSGRIAAARFAGTHVVVELAAADSRILTAHLPVGTPIEIGGPLIAQLPASACTVLPGGTD